MSCAGLISGNGATQAGGKWVTRKHIRPTFPSLTVGSPVPNSRRFIEGLVRESYKSTANPLQTLPWLRALSFVTQICRAPTTLPSLIVGGPQLRCFENLPPESLEQHFWPSCCISGVFRKLFGNSANILILDPLGGPKLWQNSMKNHFLTSSGPQKWPKFKR